MDGTGITHPVAALVAGDFADLVTAAMRGRLGI
jgi:hypothetical protein